MLVSAFFCRPSFFRVVRPVLIKPLEWLLSRIALDQVHVIPTVAMAGFDKDISTAYAAERTPDSPDGRHPVHALETNKWWKFGGRDRSYIPTRDEPSKSSLGSLTDTRDIENENNPDLSVFNDAKAYEIYKPIEKYEGRHRFDPRATWAVAEEKKLVRKVSGPKSCCIPYHGPPSLTFIFSLI